MLAYYQGDKKVNKPLIKFGICCTILAATISFYLLFTEPKFILEAHGQTQQDITNMNELTSYENTLAAFTTACTNAIGNQTVQAICTHIWSVIEVF